VIIHLQAFLGDPMSKEIHFRHLEFAFLKLSIQFVFFQFLEHLPEMLHMLFHGVAIDQNVVYVYNHKIINHSRKMSFMSVQNVAGASVRPKDITKNSYEPYLVQQAVFSSSPYVIQIW
jgi:hypothetical protein